MPADDYCLEATGGKGSRVYYCVAHLPQDKRQALLALHALLIEIESALNITGDPAPGLARLAWWRQELSDDFQHRSAHPISRALSGAIARFRFTPGDLREIMAASMAARSPDYFPDFEALSHSLLPLAEAHARIAARVLDVADNSDIESLKTLLLAIHLAETLRSVGLDARRGRVTLPEADLRACVIKREEILARAQDDRFVRLMELSIARIDRHLETAVNAIGPAIRRALSPYAILAAIERATLLEIRTEGARALECRVALTPLRMAWIAWRTRRL